MCGRGWDIIIKSGIFKSFTCPNSINHIALYGTGLWIHAGASEKNHSLGDREGGGNFEGNSIELIQLNKDFRADWNQVHKGQWEVSILLTILLMLVFLQYSSLSEYGPFAACM